MKPTRSIRIAVFGALLCIVGVLAPGQAHAHSSKTSAATPGNASSHTWKSNGCGTDFLKLDKVIPNKISGVMNFKHACDHHDGCYGGWKVNGKWVSRLGCDAKFKADMVASCKYQHGSKTYTSKNGLKCIALSGTYYSAVRNFGALAYKGPWYLR